MKIVEKIVIIFIILIAVLSVIPYNISNAATTPSTDIGQVIGGWKADLPSQAKTQGLRNIVSKLLAALRTISGLVLVLIIATTGYSYIVETPQVKKEIQKKMLPIVIGVMLVFGATSIAQFIISGFEK